MKAKSSAHYQREFRRRLREQGLVKKEVWILPENAKQLSRVEKLLRQPFTINNLENGDITMTQTNPIWTTESLYDALGKTELFQGNSASVELIEGVEAALHIVMHEYGDLPVFLTVSGEQIIVESVLWHLEEVKDLAEFNEGVLRSHKYLPLSTISLDSTINGDSYYYMFGALSSTSLLDNVVFEIEVLASNVIQAADAYSIYLTTFESVEA